MALEACRLRMQKRRFVNTSAMQSYAHDIWAMQKAFCC